MATYYRQELNDAIVRYFTAFGFQTAVIPGFSLTSQSEDLYATPLMALDEVTGDQVYRYCKSGIARLSGSVDALYINGGGWEVAPILELLESDLGIPVIWALAAEMWLAYSTLGIADPIKGCGVLLRDPAYRFPVV